LMEPLFGRGEELGRVLSSLGAGERLLTLLGPGGIGKTRLAREIAARWANSPAVFVDLSEARDEADLLAATGAALGAPVRHDSAAGALEQLAQAIASRGRCLLILDNLEQIADPAAAAIGRWLGAAPDAQVLATSREPLHLALEQRLELPPL